MAPATVEQENPVPEGTDPSEQFKREAQAGRSSLAREFWEFLKYNKKWWLLPILVLILLVGALVLLGGTGLAPFIYTVF